MQGKSAKQKSERENIGISVKQKVIKKSEARTLFITFEGADGCGKSTQAALFADALDNTGAKVVLLREPGGTKTSEAIRQLLLNPDSEICPMSELLLFEAARAQLVAEVIKPALARGAWVVCDRFFDSTSAYQRVGRALDARMVDEANKMGSCGVTPDITFVFDLSPKEALARATKNRTDRMEGEGELFQEKVRQGYLEIAKENPDRVRVIDATGSKDEVFLRVKAAFKDAGFSLFQAS